ncbi:MAG: amidohydrolase family protein [Acidobacteriaceae bacterium]|nr:amidohydrolase family protein [Acidobacteriaceae bacterium]
MRRLLPIALQSLFFSATLCAATACAQSTPVALSGTLLLPGGPVEQGTIVFQNGRILAAGAGVNIPAGARQVKTDAVIAPGFVDLHNHMSWNVFPRWKPTEEFGSRYDWQQKPVYNVLISVPHYELVERGVVCEAERYSELKALAQGETATVGTEQGCTGLKLTRELDVDNRLGDRTPATIYNVFPFQMTGEQWAQADAVLSATPHGALLIHVAEGAPHDASAAREWSMFKAKGLLRPGVSVIHGVAIPPSGFAEMAKAGVGFVWSPRSNVELYGDTAAVAAAKNAGVTLALAPDWSPTGSVGTLGELMYASLWNGTQSPAPFTDRELVAMATENPAKLVGLQMELGSLAPGHVADFVLLRRTLPDAYATLTHAAPQDVQLTVVGGAALYGDPKLLEELAGAPGEPVSVCGVSKAFAAGTGYGKSVATLTPVLQHANRALAPLTECGD